MRPISHKLTGAFQCALFGLLFAAGPALSQTSGAWTTTGSLNKARGGHTATLLASGQVLVVGGQDAAGILTSAELFDPATGKWTVTGSTATPRIDHTATLLPNGDVLVAGGLLGVDSRGNAILTAIAEVYNPSTNQWRITGSMTVARASHSATLLQDGQVLIAGGNNSVGLSGNTAELYDPSTSTWKPAGSMQNYHLFSLTLLEDGRALAVDDSGSTGAAGELYDPVRGQWTLTAGMYYAHIGSSVARLSSGDVLVYGNHFACYAGQVYNSFANTWTRTVGQCGTGISVGPLSLLVTGKVLLAGGSTSYRSISAQCFLYDPSMNTWTATGSMHQAVDHTLTRLLNGKVLAVGGSDAELYTP